MRTQGNRCNGTASSALPRPGQALAPAGARQTLNRPGCEYVSPATSPGEQHYPCGRSGSTNSSGLQSHPIQTVRTFREKLPSPQPLSRERERGSECVGHWQTAGWRSASPSPVYGRGARNASVTGRLRAGGVPAPLPFTGEGLGMRRSLADCGLAECQPLSRLRERGPEYVGHWQTAGWRSASPSPVYGRGAGNASVTGRLRAGGVLAPLPFTGEGLG